jgi:tetratricopeptide (TPR) repeat protein
MKKILSSILCLTVLATCCSSAIAKSSKDKTTQTAKVSKTKNSKKIKTPELHDANYYYEMGQDWERKNNRPGAADIPYTKALEIDPNFDLARVARMQVYYFYGQYEKALSDLNYFYHKTPSYGPAAFYEYRIDSKLKLGLYEMALDDMYEVILVYGGHAKLFSDMIEVVRQRPELQYKLSPAAHIDLLQKYRANANAIRDYAQIYKDSKGRVVNNNYYNFFISIAKSMDPYVNLYVDRPTTIRQAVDDGQVTEVQMIKK